LLSARPCCGGWLFGWALLGSRRLGCLWHGCQSGRLMA
jgi:hypothetical protein